MCTYLSYLSLQHLVERYNYQYAFIYYDEQ